MRTSAVDLARTVDAIDLAAFLERLGHEARLVPLKRETALEVRFDESLEDVVEQWVADRNATLVRRRS